MRIKRHGSFVPVVGSKASPTRARQSRRRRRTVLRTKRQQRQDESLEQSSSQTSAALSSGEKLEQAEQSATALTKVGESEQVHGSESSHLLPPSYSSKISESQLAHDASTDVLASTPVADRKVFDPPVLHPSTYDCGGYIVSADPSATRMKISEQNASSYANELKIEPGSFSNINFNQLQRIEAFIGEASTLFEPQISGNETTLLQNTSIQPASNLNEMEDSSLVDSSFYIDSNNELHIVQDEPETRVLSQEWLDDLRCEEGIVDKPEPTSDFSPLYNVELKQDERNSTFHSEENSNSRDFFDQVWRSLVDPNLTSNLDKKGLLLGKRGRHHPIPGLSTSQVSKYGHFCFCPRFVRRPDSGYN